MTGPEVLVFGGSGLLGAEVGRDPRVMCLSHRVLDLRDAGRWLRTTRPCWAGAGLRAVVNCAALTDVERSVVDPAYSEECWEVNAAAVQPLAWACRDLGLRLVHVSTDYVLSPANVSETLTEEAVVGPQTPYARSKLAGEEAALAAGATVVRVQWLYSRRRGFVWRALDRMAAGEEVALITDQVGCPTPVAVAATPILGLALDPRPTAGLWHVATRGACSYWDWVQAAARATRTPWRACPVTRATSGLCAQRAARSCLDATRVELFLHRTIPHWNTALAAMLSEM